MKPVLFTICFALAVLYFADSQVQKMQKRINDYPVESLDNHKFDESGKIINQPPVANFEVVGVQ